MKKFLTIFFLLIILPVNAKIISGEVEYNDKLTNKNIASHNHYAFNTISKYLVDTNNNKNIYFLNQGITELKDKKLVKFSDGTYGIKYYDDPLYSWYYSYNGRLISFTRNNTTSFPAKVTKYRPDGSIINIGYRVSEKESFIYSENGELLAHWLDNNCYDKNNKLIMTRKQIQ